MHRFTIVTVTEMERSLDWNRLLLPRAQVLDTPQHWSELQVNEQGLPTEDHTVG